MLSQNKMKKGVKAKTVKRFSFFTQLKAGSISPDGWLRGYALINANGGLLKYAKEKDPEIYGRLWNRYKKVRYFWDGAPDYVAYFADAMFRYANLFPDSQIAKESKRWLEKALTTQDKDGYFGSIEKNVRWKQALEIFSISVLLEAILFQDEASGDKRLLNAAKKSAALVMKIWEAKSDKVDYGIFGGHGSIILWPVLKLYDLTGETKYLDFCRDIMRVNGKQDAYLYYYKRIRKDKENPWPYDACNGCHLAVESEHVSLPAMLYEYTGEKSLLKASRAAWQMMQRHLSPAGTPHGNENMLRIGPRANCEHCGTVEWAASNHALLRIDGDVKYADAVEHAFYNAYPAAKTPDAMMYAYMHAPNQLVASEWSAPQFEDDDCLHSAQYYSTAHWPLCCGVCGPRTIPYFIQNMIQRSGRGIAIAYYGPAKSSVEIPKADSVAIHIQTEYPFEDDVRISISPEKETTFPIQFRIPGWCDSTIVKINGKIVKETITPGTFLRISRRWQKGDEVHLHFNYSIRLVRFPETGIRVGGVAVQRGPLTYTLPVAEDWRLMDKVWKKGPGKKVISYQVFAKKGAAWNYALQIDQKNPSKSFRFTHLKAPRNSRPWEHATIGLKVKAKRVLNWRIEGEKDHPMTPGMPFKPMQLDKKIETITLVPFGFSRLRMTYLPVVSTKK